MAEDITMVAGDTRVRTYTYYVGGTETDLTSSDKVWWTAKRSPYDDDDDAVIRKGTTNITGLSGITLDSGQAVVTLSPDDTADLEAPRGYYYDVQVLEAGGRLTTVVQGVLTLTRGVTAAP